MNFIKLKGRFIILLLSLGIISTIGFLVPIKSEAAIIMNAPLIYQLPELKDGCEVTSLAMLLQYKGIKVNKMTLANQVIKDPTPYRKVGGTVYWGNPNKGFVGDITGRSIGYSVYHGPIYQLASKYSSMIDLTGKSFEVLLQQLDMGKPVWVISTSTFDTVPSSQWQTIQTPSGPITMTFHEHSVLLTGYDNNYVYFNDPLANIKNRKVSRTAFKRGWEQFGKQAMTYASSMGVTDSPVSGSKLKENVNISGWFLDETGVSKIEVLVDGKFVGQAAYGDARPDVQKSYPKYKNNSSGYHYLLDISKLSSGNHTITVRETGKNEYVTTLPSKLVTVSVPKGILDTPKSNAAISGTTNISGWFLDENRVSKIEVLVDGQVEGQAVYGDSRPDVRKAYPAYNNGNSGYHYALDTTKFNDGNHTIAIRETSLTGQITTLQKITTKFINVKGYIDTPGVSMNIKGIMNVSGWFLDKSGVSKIEILIDNTIVGEAAYGSARPDVQKAYPEYNNGQAGYHFAMDITNFKEGNHKIGIRETGLNGRVVTLPERNVVFQH